MKSKLRKLHLGCGRNILNGYVNLDKSKCKGVDVVHDLDKYPWPFPPNYFDEVYGQDVIEHVDDLFRAMREIHRICKKGAEVRLIVPYWHSSAAFYPHHNFFFNVDTMKFFTEPDRSYDNYYGYRMEKITLIPSKIGGFIPPIPLPKKLFPNALNLRHLISYIFGKLTSP